MGVCGGNAQLTPKDGVTVSIILTEAQRVAAIALSGTAGGNGSPIIITIENGGVADLVLNRNIRTSAVVTEFADLIIPRVLSVSLNLGTGILTIVASETIDVTPAHYVNLDLLHISNKTNDTNIPLSAGQLKVRYCDQDETFLNLTWIYNFRREACSFRETSNGVILGKDDPFGFTVTIQLTEEQRIGALVSSGTPGGDGTAAFMDFDIGALRDVAQNRINRTFSIRINETADSIAPNVTFAAYNHQSGVITLSFQETVDLTPVTLFDMTKVRVTDLFKNKIVYIANATILSVDGMAVNISLSWAQRYAILEISELAAEADGYSGNIEDYLRIEIDRQVFQDMAGNRNLEKQVLTLFDPENSWILKRITNILVDIGDGDVAVVDYEKVFQFNGTGINTPARGSPSLGLYFDIAKFVPSSFVNKSQCGDVNEYHQGGVFGPEVKEGLINVQTLGNLLTFTLPSNDSEPFILCYRFHDHPHFKLFRHVQVSAKKIISMISSVGNSNVAVADYSKPFRFIGFNIFNGDRVRWVRSPDVGDPPINDNSCNIQAPLSQGQLSVNGEYLGDKISQSLAYITFLFMSEVGLPFRLCYKFSNEPYKLYKDITVKVKKVEGVSTMRAIVGSSQQVLFIGVHVTYFKKGDEIRGIIPDMAKYVAPGATCADDPISDELQVLRKKCETVIECETNIPGGRSTFLFETPGEGLQLCYKFGNEPYQIYPRFTMHAIVPQISFVSTFSTVQDVQKRIEFTGTLGITNQDFAKYVDYNEDCGADGMGGENMKSVETFPLHGIKTSEVRYGDFLFTSAPDPTEPWKLCYRFGDGDFLPFFDFTIIVKRLDKITTGEGSSGDAVALTPVMYFVFGGIGIGEGDRAKWVAADRYMRYSCNTPAQGGISNISDSTGTFYFKNGVEDLKLCYSFVNEPYRLYDDVEIIQEGISLEEETKKIQQAIVKFSLLLNLNDYPPGSQARKLFINKLIFDLARILGIDATRISISKLEAGSIIVTLIIAPDPSGSDLTVEQIIAALHEMHVETSSELYKGEITKHIDPEVPLLSFTETIEELVSTISGIDTDFDVKDFMDAGLFTFSENEYSVTENAHFARLTVTRAHGANDTVVLVFQPLLTKANGTTADPSSEFNEVPQLLTFIPGQRIQTLDFEIYDDNLVESHFETINLTLRVQDDRKDASVGKNAISTLRVFDYGDGYARHNYSFNVKTVTEAANSWEVVGNGVNPTWTDFAGMYSVDQQFSREVYDPYCDQSLPSGRCANSCKGGDRELHDSEKPGKDNHAPGSANFDGRGFVVTQGGSSSFPSHEITVSFWAKLPTQPRQASNGMSFFSYRVAENEAGAHEFVIYDPRSLSLAISDSVMTARHSGLTSGCQIPPQKWHHIAISWSSKTGLASFYFDATLCFNGGPYKKDHLIRKDGTVMIGQLQAEHMCKRTAHDNDGTAHPCVLAGLGSQFIGKLQSVQVWNYLQTAREIEMAQYWPLPSYRRSGLIFWWVFSANHISGDSALTNRRLMGQGSSRHRGYVTSLGVSLVDDYPPTRNLIRTDNKMSTTNITRIGSEAIHFAACEDAYSNVWYFSAPAGDLGDMLYLYNGRLQFQMHASEFSGSPRAGRGFVEIHSRLQNFTYRISAPLGSFELPSNEKAYDKSPRWTSYSIIFREDFDWTMEPGTQPPTRDEMRIALSNVTDFRIRGDMWVCSDEGNGYESVYIDKIRVYPEQKKTPIS